MEAELSANGVEALRYIQAELLFYEARGGVGSFTVHIGGPGQYEIEIHRRKKIAKEGVKPKPQDWK
jgi:hypothetical protein